MANEIALECWKASHAELLKQNDRLQDALEHANADRDGARFRLLESQTKVVDLKAEIEGLRETLQQCAEATAKLEKDASYADHWLAELSKCRQERDAAFLRVSRVEKKARWAAQKALERGQEVRDLKVALREANERIEDIKVKWQATSTERMKMYLKWTQAMNERDEARCWARYFFSLVGKEDR